jgi:hypothetical protein
MAAAEPHCPYLDMGRIAYNPCLSLEESVKQAVRRCDLKAELLERLRARWQIRRGSLAGERLERDVEDWLGGVGENDAFMRGAQLLVREAWRAYREKNRDASVVVLVDVDSPGQAVDQIALVCDNLPVAVYFFSALDLEAQQISARRVLNRRWLVRGKSAVLPRPNHGAFLLAADAAELVAESRARALVLVAGTENLAAENKRLGTYPYELRSDLIRLRGAGLRTNPSSAEALRAAQKIALVDPSLHHAGRAVLYRFRGNERFAELGEALDVVEDLARRRIGEAVQTSCDFLADVEEAIARGQLDERGGTPLDFAIAAGAFHALLVRQTTAQFWNAYWIERNRFNVVLPEEGDILRGVAKMSTLVGNTDAVASEVWNMTADATREEIKAALDYFRLLSAAEREAAVHDLEHLRLPPVEVEEGEFPETREMIRRGLLALARRSDIEPQRHLGFVEGEESAWNTGRNERAAPPVKRRKKAENIGL